MWYRNGPDKVRYAAIAFAVPLFLGACAVPLTDLPDMKGTVIDAVTGKPVEGVTVDARGRDGKEAIVHTDAQGHFKIDHADHWAVLVPLPPGPAGGGPSAPYVRVGFSASGYTDHEEDNWFRDGTNGTIKLQPVSNP